MKDRLACSLAALLVAVLAVFSTVANATVVFQFQSTCSAQCSLIGLNAGDPVSGTVGVADAAVVPNGSVGLANIESLNLQFGTFTFGLSTLGGFTGVLNATASAFSTFQFFALGSAAGYFVDQTVWRAGPAPTNAASGPGAPLARVVQTVPEPGSLALLAVALFGLGWSLRRRTERC